VSSAIIRQPWGGLPIRRCVQLHAAVAPPQDVPTGFHGIGGSPADAVFRIACTLREPQCAVQRGRLRAIETRDV